MTTEGTKRTPWVPKNGGQEIANTDGWLGGEHTMFGSPVKKKTWTRTIVDDNDDSAAAPARHMNNDFFAGTSPQKANSPKPIKIEGARNSIKDNPFLKNKVVH
jgi:hypothetical protein